jgi:KAP family P-loop domain
LAPNLPYKEMGGYVGLFPREPVFEDRWTLSEPNPASTSSLPTAGSPSGGRWPQADRPITSPGQDMLRRGSFAGRVARVIDEVRLMEDSSVLAIVGPWGSGKSSLINLAVAELGSGWKVIRANTWAPPDVAGVIAELSRRSVLPCPATDGAGRPQSCSVSGHRSLPRGFR